MVTFTIRHAGAAEDAIPVAWEDLDLDGTYETAGNVAPTEPFGLGRRSRLRSRTGGRRQSLERSSAAV